MYLYLFYIIWEFCTICNEHFRFLETLIVHIVDIIFSLTFNLFHTPQLSAVSNSFLFFFVSFYTFYTLYSHFIFMLISSDREIYHSPLIRIQNRRRVFCAGFVCLEAMQAWHGFLFMIPRDCSVFYTLAIPTHIRISWCFATLLCSCVYGAFPYLLKKIPQDCSVLCTPAIPHTFAYRGASPHFYAHVCTGH